MDIDELMNDEEFVKRVEEWNAKVIAILDELDGFSPRLTTDGMSDEIRKRMAVLLERLELLDPIHFEKVGSDYRSVMTMKNGDRLGDC